MKHIFKNYSIFLMLISTILVQSISKAQQDPVCTQYLFNLVPINPGYSGSNENFNAVAQSRHQWVGFEGAPSTQLITLNKPLPYFNSGVGLTLINEHIGSSNYAGFNANYAYHINVTEDMKLGFGASFGLKYYRVELSELVSNSDPIFGSDQHSGVLPEIGFGMFLYTSNYFVGLSTPELVKNVDIFTSDKSLKVVPNQERHYYLMGGFVTGFENVNIKLKPTVFFKYVRAAPLSVDIGVQAIYNDKFWLGVNYRYKDSFSPIMQLQLTDKIRFGYSYDITMSELKKFNSGTHEIALFYNIFEEPTKIKSPRFF